MLYCLWTCDLKYVHGYVEETIKLTTILTIQKLSGSAYYFLRHHISIVLATSLIDWIHRTSEALCKYV